MLSKRGDTIPAFAITPVDAEDLIAALDEASKARVIVRGFMGELASAEINDDFIAYERVQGGMAANPKVEADAALDFTTGEVVWYPTNSDVDSEGDWLVEVEYDLDGDGTRIQTLPTDGYFAWRIIEDEGGL